MKEGSPFFLHGLTAWKSNSDKKNSPETYKYSDYVVDVPLRERINADKKLF